ncbi:MAG: S1 RNA-binding domain-containing protein [Candidatus Cloacimonetes bacterium]|nr:S1 RNA-binding domain-containing protein [Candidatus Cloacimonadota bacterium]
MLEEIKQNEIVNEEEVKTTEAAETQAETVETLADSTETQVETAETQDDAAKTEEDFGQMLDESNFDAAQVMEGDQVTGKIVNISDTYIFVSLGDKLDGIADKADYLDAEGNFTLEIGNELTGYVVRRGESETIIAPSFSKANATQAMLIEAYEGKVPVKGRVISAIKGGFAIDVLEARGFCPQSQMDLRPVHDSSEFIGNEFDFLIIDLDERGMNVVVSRRKLLDKEREVLRKATLSQLEVGATMQGRVTRLTTFGAFVDLGGLEGLLHISEMDWSRVDSPSDVLNIGDEIEVKVIKLQGERISLSRRALLPNPLDEALKDINVDDIVSCRIVKNETFGSFAEIQPGVQGLIPISEMKRGRRIAKPSEVVKVGDLVSVKVLRVDLENRKISLSLKALEADPWDTIDDFLHKGQVVAGVIDGVTDFGVFIKLRDGLTGLLPKGKMKLGKLDITKENIGQEQSVRVAHIDTDRQRISLEPTEMEGQAIDQNDTSDWWRYAKQSWKSNKDESPFQDL